MITQIMSFTLHVYSPHNRRKITCYRQHLPLWIKSLIFSGCCLFFCTLTNFTSLTNLYLGCTHNPVNCFMSWKQFILSNHNTLSWLYLNISNIHHCQQLPHRTRHSPREAYIDLWPVMKWVLERLFLNSSDLTAVLQMFNNWLQFSVRSFRIASSFLAFQTEIFQFLLLFHSAHVLSSSSLYEVILSLSFK
jgi:hypothetical protein